MAARRDTLRRQPSGRGGPAGRGRPADLPRRTAYDVLAAVADREAYANLLLPRLLAERSMTGRDAALATELAYGTLRGLATLFVMAVGLKLAAWGYYVPEWNYRQSQGPWARAIAAKSGLGARSASKRPSFSPATPSLNMESVAPRTAP